LLKHATFERYLKLKRASIDNMFRALGYESHRVIRREETINHMLPSLAGHPEARNWSVRVRKRMPAAASHILEITGALDEAVTSLPHNRSTSPTVTAAAGEITTGSHDFSPGPPSRPAYHPFSVGSLLNEPLPGDLRWT
jgi:hypothetical protein